jgi:hypothetical protein
MGADWRDQNKEGLVTLMDAKYSKLAEDCAKAKELALQAAAKVDDGGTCNFDSVFMKLPRWNESQTLDALKAGGLSGYKTKWLGSQGFLVSPPRVGQANKRTTAMEAMKHFFEAAGYAVHGYYQMD